MFSFVINALAVILGSVVGIAFKKFIKKEICDSVLKAIGLVLFIIGIINTLKYMAVIEDGVIEISGTLLLIICICLGTFIGEFLKIEDGFNKLGLFVERKLNKGKIVEGFVTATLVYCVGSMAIIGTFDAVTGNPETIYLKSALDGITSIALASTLGFGVALSSISVFVYQGLLTILFFFLKEALPADLIQLLNMVGYVLISGIAFNFLSDKKIKVANMLPSLVIAIIYYFLSMLF